VRQKKTISIQPKRTATKRKGGTKRPAQRVKESRKEGGDPEKTIYQKEKKKSHQKTKEGSGKKF